MKIAPIILLAALLCMGCASNNYKKSDPHNVMWAESDLASRNLQVAKIEEDIDEWDLLSMGHNSLDYSEIEEGVPYNLTVLEEKLSLTEEQKEALFPIVVNHENERELIAVNNWNEGEKGKERCEQGIKNLNKSTSQQASQILTKEQLKEFEKYQLDNHKLFIKALKESKPAKIKVFQKKMKKSSKPKPRKKGKSKPRKRGRRSGRRR